jgi:hypothetical protein
MGVPVSMPTPVAFFAVLVRSCSGTVAVPVAVLTSNVRAVSSGAVRVTVHNPMPTLVPISIHRAD